MPFFGFGGGGGGFVGMQQQPSMNMGGIQNLNVSPVNGMNSFCDSQTDGNNWMGGLDPSSFGGQSLDQQLQRLRQIQQLQLFDHQIGGSQMGGFGNDSFSRIQAENAMNFRLNRQPC